MKRVIKSDADYQKIAFYLLILKVRIILSIGIIEKAPKFAAILFES